MKQRYGIILLVVTIPYLNLIAQILDKSRYSKIIVPRNISYQIVVDSVYIDTLIMENDSKFVFSLPTILIIEAATIGERCVWDASGEDAIEAGNDGQSGKSISSVMFIRSLGSLTINTQGGRGANGAAGQPGSGGLSGAEHANGEDGGIGGDGGNSGNGGDIKFHYSGKFVSFLPSEGREKQLRGRRWHAAQSADQFGYTVIYNNKGGKRGEGGRGGRGGPAGMPKGEPDYQTGKIISVGNRGLPGRSGQSGNPGVNGVDGRLIFKRFD